MPNIFDLCLVELRRMQKSGPLQFYINKETKATFCSGCKERSNQWIKIENYYGVKGVNIVVCEKCKSRI